jgi:hypothetical protein
MNKKIMVLAFVSAAFLFGCTADLNLPSSNVPPAWDGVPSTTGPSTGEPPIPPGGGRVCVALINDTPRCIEIEQSFDEEDCDDVYGQVMSSCPL